MGWIDAKASWSAWTVSPLNFYLFLPGRIPSANLPVIYLQQIMGRGEGQRSRGFTTPLADNVMYWRCTCLVAPVAFNLVGWNEGIATSYLDSYLTQVAADPDLAGLLRVPMTVIDPAVGVVRHNLLDYIGFSLTHRWEMVES